MRKQSADSALKVIPLGGLHEIGKNTCVFEINDEIMLLDAGLAFPTDGMHGVNIVLPDVTYLRENRHKIKGMVVTHGHEDHIGGIPFHLKQFDIPVIYGPRLAMALLEGKLEEAGVRDRTELRSVRPRETVRIGKSFLVEYIRNTHSIADSCSVAIHTPAGIVIHTGDFKIDHTPVDGEYFDFQKFAEYGERGVLCLISDSTNSEVSGYTPSERAVFPNLDRTFAEADGRLIVTTFASSVHRVSMILDLAQKHNRMVFVVGRSMLNVIAHARSLGYMKCEDDRFQPLRNLNQYSDRDVLILTTGSQGEPMAALTRIANGCHRQIKVREGDTVVFSANPIPGNTIAVVNTIDKLMVQGAKVVYGRDKGIHVSGHGSQEDQKLMLGLTRPKFFLPVHGEHRMLVRHSQTAQAMGIPAENIVIIKNGDIVELTPDRIAIAGQVPSGIELVDSSRQGVDRNILRDRQQLAEDGMLTVAVVLNQVGKRMTAPALHVRGIAQAIEEERLQRKLASAIDRFVQERSFNESWNPEEVRPALETELRKVVRRELPKRYPMVVLLLQKVEGAAPESAPAARPMPVLSSVS
ncbi:MAG: ribonuclease J [Leptolyngbyaceae cyanobacterium T60_A2020_046]|nr:ribonuclease J [Leptolyngbyaceae cyanobacterium T60_A2020_046]